MGKRFAIIFLTETGLSSLNKYLLHKVDQTEFVGRFIF